MPFDPLGFEELVAKECGGDHDSEQVKYLAAYFRHGGFDIGTIVVEHPYVDRHYIEEFSRYYATSFRAPSAHTTRLHLFAETFDDDDLGQWVADAASGDEQFSALRRRLRDAYRGFIVIRPLPAAPIGRTVVATYADRPARNFETLQTNNAHLLGFELSVQAVPFQQQEEAVGACATTAVWSALASIARATGHRAPTPYAVTEAATRHVLNDRQLPAQSGLDLQQLLAAIRECGFAPHVMKASDNFEAFSHALKCYLASGIPVVLLLHEPSGYHAVTAVGFRSPDDEYSAPDIVYETGKVQLKTSGLVRLYVHEDRLGPYSRMAWEPPADDKVPTLRHLPFNDSRYTYDTQPMKVWAAIAPLYPKLRLTPRGLLRVASETLPLIRTIAGAELRDSLRVDLQFSLSGDYQRELLRLGVDDPARVAKFVSTAALPRYVGRVRFFVGDAALGDVICDTTDIFREQPKYGSILALFPFVSSCVEAFEKFSARWLG